MAEEGELAGEGSGYWYEESGRLAADGCASLRSCGGGYSFVGNTRDRSRSSEIRKVVGDCSTTADAFLYFNGARDDAHCLPKGMKDASLSRICYGTAETCAYNLGHPWSKLRESGSTQGPCVGDRKSQYSDSLNVLHILE